MALVLYKCEGRFAEGFFYGSVERKRLVLKLVNSIALVVWLGFMGIVSVTKKYNIHNCKSYDDERYTDCSTANKIIHVYHKIK